MKAFGIRLLLVLGLLPLLADAQGAYIPLGSETYHYLDRLEIKSGLVNEFHSSNKPYDRKIVMDFVGKIDTGIVDVELSDLDQKNIDYIYEDNFEFDTDEKIERRDRDHHHPRLKGCVTEIELQQQGNQKRHAAAADA